MTFFKGKFYDFFPLNSPNGITVGTFQVHKHIRINAFFLTFIKYLFYTNLLVGIEICYHVICDMYLYSPCILLTQFGKELVFERLSFHPGQFRFHPE